MPCGSVGFEKQRVVLSVPGALFGEFHEKPVDAGAA